MFPGPGEWHRKLGTALMVAGDLPGAERELEISIALSPRDGGALYDLGAFHAQRGDFKRAEDELARGLKLFQHPAQFAYLQLAVIADFAGDQQESERLLEQSAKMPEGPVPVAVARARIRFSHRDYAGAEEALKPLLPQYRNVVDIWAVLGAAAERQGHLEEALNDYRTALGLAPNAAPLHLGAAITLAHLGRRDDALKECRRALQLDPGNQQAHKLMRNLTPAAGTGSIRG